MKLYITQFDKDTLPVVRAVRDALREFHPSASTHDAHEVLRRVSEQGYCLIGEGDPRGLAEVTGRLDDAGIVATVDLDDEAMAELTALAERRRRARETREDKAAGKTPEQVFAEKASYEPEPSTSTRRTESPQVYETAMAILAAAEGNVLRAAAIASNLRHTTRDQGYRHVLEAYMLTFPWAAANIHAAFLTDATT